MIPPKASRTVTVCMLALVGLAALSTSCAEDPTQFNVRYAPTFQRSGMTVSVLGVFKEGRMSPETWEELGPKISPVFGKGSCPVGYDAKLAVAKPDLANAVDDYARANGITDDLLEQLAPAASGDAVLVLTVAGRPIVQKGTGIGVPSTPMQAPTQSPMSSTRMRGHGGGMAPPSAMTRAQVDRNAFEMTASLFSVRDHKSVALLTMGYAGPSTDEAVAKFVEKLRASFTGFPCVGWNMDAPIDDKKIEKITNE